MYTGCPGEKPCDALDACCMVHDACVTANNSIPSIPFSLSTPVLFYNSDSPYKNKKSNFINTILKFENGTTDDYLNLECNQNLSNCIAKVNTAGPTFQGNKCSLDQVSQEISLIMDAAILAGRALHKP
ncbi:Phospholipase A2 family protein [Rhynchospora pubera]|uniref:Phospholipase A2 family protein n=1 Tax=Rhynchospora pubera TaxID=906938 RepID=A0AAV8HU63_9POAL|nr:Phospholipase A2 family protein [Rhynchospora pubera]